MIEKITIGAAANQSGVKVPTIRYYETIGLLAAPRRTAANRRLYDANEICAAWLSSGTRGSLVSRSGRSARCCDYRTNQISHAQWPTTSRASGWRTSSNASRASLLSKLNSNA
jgi:hypothetical protein